MTLEASRLWVSLRLLLLTLGVVAVQGYHFGVEDGAIYIPAIEHAASPQLFPYGQIFFARHAGLSILAPAAGELIRLTHMPLEVCALGLYLLGTFLLLVAGFWVAGLCFTTERARWGAVLLLGCVLPTQVAGTALPIMDNYLTARTLSTPLTFLAFAAFLDRRAWLGSGLTLLTATVHPQMAVYGLGFLGIFWWLRRRVDVGQEMAASVAGGLMSHLPAEFHWGPARDPYRKALYERTFFFAWAWRWYEWLGVVAPLGVLWGVGRLRRPEVRPLVSELCRALLVLGGVSTAVFLVLGSSANFDSFTRLQPMRSFHLIYVFLFLFLGGLLGEFGLRERWWRWVVVYGALCCVMFGVDRNLYPASDHLELPGRAPKNEWVQAFRWVRASTPEGAVFALPPRYLKLPGEDTHGFRGIAERSALADELKDSGVVSVFPQAAGEWWRERAMTVGWERWSAREFKELRERTPATWVVVELRQSAGLECPYRNGTVAVCRLE